MAQWKPVTGACWPWPTTPGAVRQPVQEDKLGQVAGDESADPINSMRDILANLKSSIVATTVNVNTGSLDSHELKPIHRQLMEGEKKTKADWSRAFLKEVAKEKVGGYETAMKDNMAKLMGDVEGAVAQFDSCQIAVIKEFRSQAGLVGRRAVAGRSSRRRSTNTAG